MPVPKERLDRDYLGIKKIGLPVLDGLSFINLNDIIYCEAKGSYTVITLTNNKSFTTFKILKEVEMMLMTNNFLRVHNSWIINLNYLKNYFKGKSSYMEMENGKSIAVSLRKKGDILELFR